MDKTAEAFVNYAANLRYTDLTPQAIHAVKRSVVDSIGCAYGGFYEEPMKAVRRIALQVTATKPATVIGTQIRSSPELAALANGAMIRYPDFSDDYFGGNGDTGPHPSDNIGGILAACESAGADGKSLILGVAIAYEACGQLVDHTALRVHGWDHPVFHSIATALGSARVLGLSKEQMRNALALAIVPNICLFQTRLGNISNWKGFAGPNGSRNGLFATLLAQQGITGPGEPFEGKAGFMKQLNNPFELGAFGGGDIPYKIERTFFKYRPLRYTIQLPVSLALDLRSKIDLRDLESIWVYVENRSVVTPADSPDYWDPCNRETADHSAPYLIGAALVDGEITAETFTPRRYRDPMILSLIRKIRIAEDPEYTAAFPRTFNCRFEATLKSGKVVTVHQANPKGHPANPMSDQDIEDKFLRQVDTLLPKEQAVALLKQLWKLEELDDISQVFDLMLLPAHREGSSD